MEQTQNCPVAATLELIGGKYKALILWHLSGGTLRFSELHRQVGSATAKMLTQQLRELEAQGLILRDIYPVIPPRVEYSLTELGRSLLPILVAMRDWGAAYLQTKDIQASCFMMDSDPLHPSCSCDSVGLSMMCYTLGKEKRTALGDFQLRGRIGK